MEHQCKIDTERQRKIWTHEVHFHWSSRKVIFDWIPKFHFWKGYNSRGFSLTWGYGWLSFCVGYFWREPMYPV